ADGKITSFYADTAPASGMATGDLWYDTNDKNKPHYWNGGAWVSIRDGTIADAAAAAATAQQKANDAQAAADAADAILDKISADGWLTRGEKPQVMRQHQIIGQEIP